MNDLFNEPVKPKQKSAAWDYNNQPDGKDEWLTPRYITDALGPFDLDPCSPIVRPWPTATCHLTIEDNGLTAKWDGVVFCNPPYNEAAKWLGRCADHKNAIALVFARTETRMWHNCIWNVAHAVFFFKGRITFHHVDGRPAKWTGGAPSALVAYGDSNVDRILLARDKGLIDGYLVSLLA